MIQSMLLAWGKPQSSNVVVKEANLTKAQERMKWAIDEKRIAKAYKMGDEVAFNHKGLEELLPTSSP